MGAKNAKCAGESTKVPINKRKEFNIISLSLPLRKGVHPSHDMTDRVFLSVTNAGRDQLSFLGKGLVGGCAGKGKM